MLEEVSNSALDAVERATLKDRETSFILLPLQWDWGGLKVQLI